MQKYYQVSIKFRGPVMRWLRSLDEQHINKSAAITEILEAYLNGDTLAERLDRIEAILKSGQFSSAQAPMEDMNFDDMILDSDL